METAQMTDSEMTMVRNREISALRSQYPRMGYSAARNQVRQLHPELFGLPAHGAQPVVNRHSPPPGDDETLRKIQAGIDELMAKNRKLTYGTARDLLRRQKPQLFGLAKA